MSEEDMEVDLIEEVENICIDEEFILNRTGESKLMNIKHLSLQNQGLVVLDMKLFNKMPLLERLNVSINQLTSASFPSGLNLRVLTSLDVSNNYLSDLEFVQLFPALTELFAEQNNVELLDKSIAMTLSPTLNVIDKTKRETLMRIVNDVSEKIEPKVADVWEEAYAEKYEKRIPERYLHSVTDELVLKTKSVTVHLVKDNLEKLKDFLLRRICEEHVHKVQSGLYKPPKRLVLSPKPVKEYQFTKLKETELPNVDDYDPLHFVRCHFGDREAKKNKKTHNDPTDEYTKVWSCAFEPSLKEKRTTTNVVATCGGEIVCLLDCKTGSVLKRYRCPHEQFFVLAWTTVKIKKDGREWSTNILAVAGHNAKIKLLHPEQLVCYDSWGDGRPNRTCAQLYATDILFHPRKPTHMYCASSDSTVTLWDIGLPSGTEEEIGHRKLAIYGTEMGGILGIAFCSRTYNLVAGCEEGICAWNCDLQSDPKKKIRKTCKDLFLPGKKRPRIECLKKVSKDFVACREEGDSVVYIWSLSATLNSTSSRVTIKPLAKLDWVTPSVEYINLGGCHGLIGCGDHEGNIWMYNIDPLLQKRSCYSDTLLKASRVIKWPHCELTKQRDEEQKMIDVLDEPEPLVINTVSFSSDLKYMVAVTDNNLVCVWQISAES